ncbi:MAG: hypothetical protein RJQ14_00130 [Marinoscillum sp.]
MDTFDWKELVQLDPEDIRDSRYQLHHAVQNVAAIGRKFLPYSEGDENAVLTWVPGLMRMAGKWVEGDISFRSSLSFDAFSVFLVDEKVITLASFELEGNTHSQLMVWLEEQIGKLGLEARNLTMNLPYSLPEYDTQSGEAFHLSNVRAASELGKYYHNTYVTLRAIKEKMSVKANINIWPHHFDMALDVILKDTGDVETNTKISFGMSPGDQHFENPYFYVNCWPHVDTQKMEKLSNNAIWVSDDWTGAVLHSKNLFVEPDQQKTLDLFYQEASQQLIETLTK